MSGIGNKSVGGHKRLFYKNLLRDIRANGIGYLKSEIAANELRKLSSDIEIEYNKEDRLYIARYTK